MLRKNFEKDVINNTNKKGLVESNKRSLQDYLTSQCIVTSSLNSPISKKSQSYA